MIEVYRSEKGGEECQDILRLAYNIDVTDKKQQQELEQELKGKLSIFDINQESYPIINFHDFSIINLMGRIIILFSSKQHFVFFYLFLSRIGIIDYEVKYLLCSRHLTKMAHIA